MTTMARTVAVVLMAVVPGGLLVMAAYVMARLVAERLPQAEGRGGLRLARAVAMVRWRDVVARARSF